MSLIACINFVNHSRLVSKTMRPIRLFKRTAVKVLREMTQITVNSIVVFYPDKIKVETITTNHNLKYDNDLGKRKQTKLLLEKFDSILVSH